MTSLRVYFSPTYTAPDTFPSVRLNCLAEQLRRCDRVDVVEPAAFDKRWLHGLHSEDYIAAFLQGIEPLASSQGAAWSAAVRDSVLAMLGGQIEAAEHALAHGIAMNLARGFHHAVWARGAGSCAMNGLALLAHRWPERRIFVLDCDEHGGNGTEEFAARFGNLYNASIFGTRFGCYGGVRSWDFPVNVAADGYAVYAAALESVRGLLREHRPDLLVYQAGVDCHRDDPKGRVGLSTRQLLQRDRWVFRTARELKIPVLFVVAGGYQDAATLARLNGNTVRAAVKTYFGGASSAHP